MIRHHLLLGLGVLTLTLAASSLSAAEKAKVPVGTYRVSVFEGATKLPYPTLTSVRLSPEGDTSFTTYDDALMHYCVDLVDQTREAVGYVDRILRGDKPADLPVQPRSPHLLVPRAREVRGRFGPHPACHSTGTVPA